MQYKDRHAYKRDAYARGDYETGHYSRTRNPGAGQPSSNFIYVTLTPEAVKLRERFGLATHSVASGKTASAPKISGEQKFVAQDPVATVARAVERSIFQGGEGAPAGATQSAGGVDAEAQKILAWIKDLGRAHFDGKDILQGFSDGLLRTLNSTKAYYAMTPDPEQRDFYSDTLERETAACIDEIENNIPIQAAFKQLVVFLDAAVPREDMLDIQDIEEAISAFVSAREHLPQATEAPKHNAFVLAGIEKINELVKSGETGPLNVRNGFKAAAASFGSALYADEAPGDFEKLLSSVMFLLKDAKGYDE